MTQPAQPLRIPETMGAAEIGPYMRSIREHFKITPQEVSERLHIRVRYVNAIEESKFDLMPGKVYARGYIHTYAEFLGLDADQVVAQCFKDDKPSAVVAKPGVAPRPGPSFAPRMTLPTPQQSSNFLQGMWLPALGLVFLLVVVTQVFGGGDDVPAVTESEKVVTAAPEALLAPQYNDVMPTAPNFECLTGDGLYLTCFMEQRIFDEMDAYDRSNSLPFAPNLKETGPVDLSNSEHARDD